MTEPAHRRPLLPLSSDVVEVHDLADDHLHLVGEDAARPGWWGLPLAHGYARVGPAVAVDGASAIRPLEWLDGAVAAGGEQSFLDPWAAADPSPLGVDVTEVLVAGPLGHLPAWWFPPTGPHGLVTVLVHGRSGTRAEALRLVPAVLAAGAGALVVSYRNDGAAPPSPDGRSHLGATEWEDVAAACRWALQQPEVDRLVLGGLSMGGACVAETLRHTDLGDRVAGVILEAPVLDWGPVLRAAAVQRGLPSAALPLLLPPTMALAGRRAGIDWRSLGSFTDLTEVPLLLVHGDADPTVPVELADALAAALPDQVTYLRVPGAGHLRAWNVARDEVEQTVRNFVAALGRPGEAADA
jgi:dienelactone hydrolase